MDERVDRSNCLSSEAALRKDRTLINKILNSKIQYHTSNFLQNLQKDPLNLD